MIPTQSDEMPNKEMTGSIISGTENKSCENECEDTGIIWQNQDSQWCRKCPKCHAIIVHPNTKAGKYYAKRAIASHKLCSKCSHNNQSHLLRKARHKIRIVKVCIKCKEKFEVPPSHHYRKCCSRKCVIKARRENLLQIGLKGKGMPKEQLDIQQKYYKYKEYDLLHGHVFDWRLEALRRSILGGCCYYCGRTEWLGLDRIDNTLGHSKKNTVICCELCNMTRGNRFTHEEMKTIGVAIASLHITDRRNSRQGKNNIFRNQNDKIIQ